MPAKKPARRPANKMPPPRVPILAEDKLTPAQRALLGSIRSGPRGGSTTIRGPFAVFLHAPAFGELAQQLGGHCRFKTAVAPRLSEFAILATAKLWRAIYDFIQELYKTRRVSDKTFARVRAVLGEAATVEFVGILGYYALISMILNVFRMSPPEGQPLPFAETSGGR